MFFRKVFAAQIFGSIFFQRDARIAALLRTPVHEPILADVEVARTGAAPPIVCFALGDIVLESVDARKPALAHSHDFFEDFNLASAERFQLSLAVVQNAHGAGEAQFLRAASNLQRVLRIFHAAAKHGINVHLKHGVVGEQFQFLIKDLEAFHGNFVGHRVVDADLQIFQPRAVKPLDAFGGEEISVRDHSGKDSVLAHARDDLVEFGVQERLAAADRHDRRAEISQTVDPANHFRDVDRLREIVEFVAICAGQIAASGRDDMHEQRMPR